MVVARRTSITFRAWAFTSGVPSISMRRKTIPVFSGAGSIRILTLTPVCKAIPLTETLFPMVFCISMNDPLFLRYYSISLALLGVFCKFFP